MNKPSAEQKVSWRAWLAVLGSLLGGFMAVLDIQITNASLNDILGSLSATFDEGSWISTSYLVAEIVVIGLSDWLTRVFGIRRYLVTNAGLFLVFSIGCAWAWDLHSMIVFRALQGFAGGVLIPLSFTIILRMLPPSKRAIGFAMFAVTAVFAPAIGPTIGGWLTDRYGWHSIFYMNLVPGAVLISAIWIGLDDEPKRLHLLRKADWWGILSMSVGLSCLTICLEEGNRKDWFGSPMICRLAVVAAISLTAFIFIELSRQEPFLNLRLLAQRNFGLASLVNVVVGCGLYGMSYILPLYLAQIQGYNALEIGRTIMWVGLPQLCIIPFVPLLLKRFDSRVLITIGLGLFGASAWMNGFMTNQTGYDQLQVSQIIRALGQPLVMVPLLGLATGGIKHADAGAASSLFNMLRNLGGSMGIALLSTMLTRQEQFHSVRIGESVSIYDTAVQLRLTELTQGLVARGQDITTAGQQALAALNATVRRESYVMAFNDCFLMMAVLLMASACLIWFCHRSSAGGPGH